MRHKHTAADGAAAAVVAAPFALTGSRTQPEHTELLVYTYIRIA